MFSLADVCGLCLLLCRNMQSIVTWHVHTWRTKWRQCWKHGWWWRCTKIKFISNTVIATTAKKTSKRRQVIRTCWVRLWICDCPRFGGFEAQLTNDIRVTDSESYHNVCRLNHTSHSHQHIGIHYKIHALERQFQPTNKTFDRAVHTTLSTAT